MNVLDPSRHFEGSIVKREYNTPTEANSMKHSPYVKLHYSVDIHDAYNKLSVSACMYGVAVNINNMTLTKLSYALLHCFAGQMTTGESKWRVHRVL